MTSQPPTSASPRSLSERSETKRSMSRPYDPIKRLIDIIASVLLLLLTAPIQLIVAAMVALNFGRPVLFRQPRPGKDGIVFTLMKFRTMRPVDERRGWSTDADRLTPFGERLRSLSLDELPTLWNVLKGDMSLVGPRPLLVEYLDKYTLEQARRHEVRPGVTGLAQVNGRNALTWEQKFRYDVRYVDHRGLGVDVRILFETVRSVFVREGISHDGHATMHKFGETTDA